MYKNMEFKTTFPKKDTQPSTFKKILQSFFIKTLIVAIIFIIALIYVKKDDNNKENIKKVVYQNSLSFAKIYSVYKKYLGDVIPFKNNFKNNTKLVSDEKISYDNIKKENDGYVLELYSNYVPIIKTGIVIEIKKDDKYINIVKIQDKNGLNISYGYLNNIDVKLYDYVNKGQIIGKCNKKLYLIFEKDNKYLSYNEYL